MALTDCLMMTMLEERFKKQSTETLEGLIHYQTLQDRLRLFVRTQLRTEQKDFRPTTEDLLSKLAFASTLPMTRALAVTILQSMQKDDPCRRILALACIYATGFTKSVDMQVANDEEWERWMESL